ncbi:MAG: hypothetical protein KME22_30850 [Hassallia sp. WJT32-NPBG1]|jgi:hypothetical protein|nr:hypothetical protein [Hassallia sp. WJT32-NPBG1]
MDAKTLFYLNSLRTKIAFKEAVQDWKPQIQGPMKCPLCESEKVYIRMSPQDGNTHICQSCKQNFSREMLPGCQCVRPGNLMKCLDCPRFEVFIELLKEKVSGLQGLNRQELKKLLGDCELPLNYTVPRVLPITFKYE